ncbi:hypothetical protein GQ53DRAFT_815638 [Thozetella sp. PMI_491]|nr:hypothetical protein GQ53DRAFT_815638 [Thozetella sp. PMI_491]
MEFSTDAWLLSPACIIRDGGGSLLPEGTPEECSNPKPVEKCTVYVSIYTPDGQSTKTTTSETACATTTVCDKIKDSTTTTTVTSSASVETMLFTHFDPLPTRAAISLMAAMGSSIDSHTSIWNKIFAAPTETITKPPSEIGAICTPAVTGAENKIYSYCDCGTDYGSTLPYIPSTTGPCDYTTLPAICRYGASPQQNRYYCNCEGYPHTLPTLTTKDNVCGYTDFPDPWPYTSTDDAGNVIACETSSVSGDKTECSGDSYTATAAPPKPTEKPRCITAHTYMANCLTEGDTMSVQIWERGVQVCKGAKNIFGASDRTEYKYDCGNGASAMVTDNGAKLVYKSSDGYETTITRSKGHSSSQVCGYLERANGNVIELKGFLFEYAFANDQCGNCQTTDLCDFNAICKFDGTCS